MAHGEWSWKQRTAFLKKWLCGNLDSKCGDQSIQLCAEWREMPGLGRPKEVNNRSGVAIFRERDEWSSISYCPPVLFPGVEVEITSPAIGAPKCCLCLPSGPLDTGHTWSSVPWVTPFPPTLSTENQYEDHFNCSKDLKRAYDKTLKPR